MQVFKLRATKLRMTKKWIEESQRHLQLKSLMTTLTSNPEIYMNGSKRRTRGWNRLRRQREARTCFRPGRDLRRQFQAARLTSMIERRSN
jgi:hypothetical protein